MSAFPEADQDATGELAELLGVARADLLEAIGGAWCSLRDATFFDSPSDFDGLPYRTWFIAGDPWQVMLGVGELDVQIATPEPYWTITPRLRFGEIVGSCDRFPATDMDALSEAVREAQNRRRASFRYCRYCRRLTAPEHGGEACHGCSSRYFGIVY